MRKNIRFGSICSGIEAASVAFAPLGWRAAWFSEIEPFPCSLLAHHYPDVPNMGDMLALPAMISHGLIEAPDVLCGGTPCQAFSVAGNRRSLDDARGNLSLTFCEIADAIDDVRLSRGEPECVILWENVPGVLSTKDNAFGCFLAGLAGETEPLLPPGGKWADAGYVSGPSRTIAWRILDAQYFGLAQRRRRVFVVASARDRFDPAKILFESDGVRRDHPPSREAGEETAGTLDARAAAGGFPGTDGACAGHIVPAVKTFDRQSSGEYGTAAVASTICARDSKSPTDLISVHGTQDPCTDENIAFALGRNNGQENTIAHSLRGDGFDASEDGMGRGTPLVTVLAFSCKDSGADSGPLSPTLPAMSGVLPNGGGQVAVACFKGGQGSAAGSIGYSEHLSPTLSSADSGSNRTPALLNAMQVRRLTPTECERLQGFPDSYTLVPHRNKPAADGPRYKALGNSWAVPCVRWIGERILDNLQ